MNTPHYLDTEEGRRRNARWSAALKATNRL